MPISTGSPALIHIDIHALARAVGFQLFNRSTLQLPDASFYDIRARFQGFNPNGHMNPDSPDAAYTRLLAALRDARKPLAARIASKVCGHAFLR